MLGVSLKYIVILLTSDGVKLQWPFYKFAYCRYLLFVQQAVICFLTLSS